jgi:hypothetical protein
MRGVCAPNVDVSTHYTCFTRSELQDIAIAFNKYIQKNSICKGKTCIPKVPISDVYTKSQKELWYSIYKRLAPFCKYEYCWIDYNFINKIEDKDLLNKLKYFTFKPKMTRGQYSWLSTDDINAIMKQYNKIYDTHYFIGALPSDFYKLIKANYTHLFKKYDMVSAILNLDTHDQPGSHWVGFVVDNRVKTIEYFDSVGKNPNKIIRSFIKDIHKKMPGYAIKINKVKHQHQNSECGVYSLYYVIQRLLGSSFESLSSTVILDKDMNKFRNVVFRPRTRDSIIK